MNDGLIWRKASFSTNQGNCVELAHLDTGRIGLRDSKLGDDSPVLTLSRAQVADLVDTIKAGRFDDLT
jgi:hypothetical protein